MEANGRRRIGRYELLGELGRGAMSVVYLARDPLIGRRIALKALDAGDAMDPAARARLRGRFLNEAQSAGNLSHPGVVTIHDLIEEGDSLYLAMEYVEGRDLREILSRPDPIPLEMAGRILDGVAGVLDHAHDRGLVHRDIKPANILITKDQRIKVTDFGIAHLRSSGLADDLKQLGTPSYLAPERALGEEGDSRVDVYSLGVVLYEMVTRRLPFYGETVAELTRSVALDEYTPPEQYVRNLPRGLRDLLARALAKDPGERFDRAGELARAFAEVVRRQASLRDTVPAAVVAPPPGPPPEPPPAPPAAATSGAASGERTSTRVERLPPRVAGGLLGRWRAALGPPWRRSARLALALAAVGLAAAIVLVAGLRRGAPDVDAADAADAAEDDSRARYLTLLEQGRRLYAAGDVEAADAVLARADALAPTAGRIERLRREARWQASLDVAGEIEAERQERLQAAERALAGGYLDRAWTTLERARELAPDDAEVIELQRRVEGLLSERRETRARALRAAAAPPVQTPAELPPVEVAAPAPPRPALDAPAELRIDFSSELSRGVLTVYAGPRQLLRRRFRFVERESFLRRRAVGGSFDARLALPPGPVTLRVYVALAGMPTRLESLDVVIPAGGRLRLEVAVDGEGELAVGLR